MSNKGGDNNRELLRASRDIVDKSLTQTNPWIITNTTAVNELNAYAIYAISDATFTTLDTSAAGNTLIGQTLSAGDIWYIPIKGTVELAGGAVIVYRHDNKGTV